MAEPQPEQVPDTQQAEKGNVSPEEPSFDEKAPVAEVAPEPAPEMGEDPKDGDGEVELPVLDEEPPVSVQTEPDTEPVPENMDPQEEPVPVEEGALDEEPPVFVIPEAEPFHEMENLTTEEEVTEAPVEPGMEPESEQSTEIPHSALEEETTDPVEEGQEVGQLPIEHKTVPEGEPGKLFHKLN